ncbi:MAG: alpha/beta fold hydrolase [Chloroflexota bacterium]
MTKKSMLVIAVFVIFLSLLAATPHQQTSIPFSILDRSGTLISKLTDGDTIRFQVKTTNRVTQPTPVSFSLLPDNTDVAECTIAQGSASCQTDLFSALGWYWNQNHQARSNLTVRAIVGGSQVMTIDVQVSPRPVVFVHGFGSSAAAWTAYLGDQGYLAKIGVRGFAVGDGQVKGKLNLGNLANPTGPTETLRSNAEILRDYIANVKQLTGAQMVDLVAHSMGNLVSRYYIDRVMPGRDLAQLIMLGPPNQGTACAYLPSSLGYYLPAALEIRPSYVQRIFNPQITQRHGVPFTIIAGTPIVEQLKSPCTAVPSDLAIALASAGGINAPLQQVDAWHVDLNVSASVFADFIKPRLQKTVGEFSAEPDPAPPALPGDDLQFTRVFTGHVNPGSSTTQTINIDNVTVASFAMFDPTRSLTVTVRGATGNVIVLDPTRNGLVVVKDPATLVYLGYGFNNPRPGPWQVTVQSTPETPSSGADYALTAHLVGGAVLKAQASPLLPEQNAPVLLSARLEQGGQLLAIRDATARISQPDGATRIVALTAAGNEWRANWIPGATGLYGLDVTVNGTASDGTLIERTAFLSIEAQPTPEQFLPLQAVLILTASLIVVLMIAWGVRRRHRRAAK